MAEKRTRRSKTAPEQVRVVTSGSNIRFEEVEGKRAAKARKSNLVVNVTPDIHPVSNFLGFLKEHAVVGLIIGFVIGNQVQSLVKQLIQSFLNPLTQLLFGTALSNRTFTLHLHHRSAQFGWGAMVYAMITFLFVIIAMYVAIKFLNLETIEKQKKEKEA